MNIFRRKNKVKSEFDAHMQEVEMASTWNNGYVGEYESRYAHVSPSASVGPSYDPPYYACTASSSAMHIIPEVEMMRLASGTSQVVPYATWASNTTKPKRFINSYKCPWCGQWTEKLYYEYCGGPQQ